MNCAERKIFLLDNISRDIEAHESGRFNEIGAWEKTMTMSRWEKCDDIKEETRHRIAYHFCDSWQDARNHEWNYYRGVEEKDWLIIARQIYRGFNEGWTDDAMRDNFVFNPPPKVSLWQRWKNFFRLEL